MYAFLNKGLAPSVQSIDSSSQRAGDSVYKRIYNLDRTSAPYDIEEKRRVHLSLQAHHFLFGE